MRKLANGVLENNFVIAGRVTVKDGKFVSIEPGWDYTFYEIEEAGVMRSYCESSEKKSDG
jgi:hypothetical protein